MKSTQNPERERRVYERHEYTGHIVVGRPTKGSVLAGTILNLSIGGCLIKLRTPTDLKAEAIIEIGIHCGPLAFCTLGAIKRHETDACMIGIEFLNLGLEGRRNLRELIAGFKAAGPNEDTAAKPIPTWAVQCLCNPA